MTGGRLVVVHPEWQGFGLHQDVRDGALALAEALLGRRERMTVDVPAEERLVVADGVLGLGAIVRGAAQVGAALGRAAPERIVSIGGTCGSELAPVSYLNARATGDLAVVWFDAHADLNTPSSSPSGHFHGMILRTLLGEGPVALTSLVERPLAATQVFLAGTRELDPPEAAFIDARGIDLTPPADLVAPDRLIARIRAAGFTRVYVHLDVDVFDPDVFPDVLMPAPGGTTPEVVGEAVGALAEAFDLVGFSIVEFCLRSADGIERLRPIAGLVVGGG